MDIGRTLPPDITRDLFEELLAFKSLYEGVAKTVSDSVLELDARGCIVRFNAAAEALTGHSAQSLVGKTLRDLLFEPKASFALPDDSEAHPLNLTFRDTAGKPLEVRARSIAMPGPSAVEGWIVSFHSVRSTEIEQLKNELVSTVSHELKTPLASIKAYAATLRQNPHVYERDHDEFLSIIEQQADRLSRMIDDMLLVARVDAAQLLRRRMLVPLDNILDRVLDEVLYDPARHSIVRETADIDVSGDPERLHDVFRNLVENAIKYSPEGGEIFICASQSNDSTTVEVRDSGVGIEDEHLPYIFDRFFRVDSDLSSRVGGSGLGLFIVHALVRAHGGTIDVRSELGGGTKFLVTLPVRK